MKHLDSADGRDTAFARWCLQVPDSYAHLAPERPDQWSGVDRRVVGGRGLYWGGVLCRINPAELERDAAANAWLQRQGLDEAGAGYAEVIARLSALDFYWRGGWHFPIPAECQPFISIARAAARRGGHPIFSPLEYFQLTSAETVNVHLVTDAEVAAVRMNGNHFMVEYQNAAGLTQASSRSLILAAGLRENCRLLETWRRTRQIYQFTDHLVAGAACFVPTGSKAGQLLAGAGREIYFKDRAATEGFNLFLTGTPRSDGWVLDIWGMGEKDLKCPLNLTTDGHRVAISGRKSRTDEAKELAMQAAALQVLDELSAAYGERLAVPPLQEASTKVAMRRIHFEACPPGLSIAYTSELGSVDHEACIHNPVLELDDLGRVPNSRLFVVGPGALKRMGSANPNFTALSLAGKVGEAAAAA
jgi:hypothetical protein